MRLVGTFKDPHLGKKFSYFLSSKRIQHQIDMKKNEDWGSDDFGTILCSVWSIDEDQYGTALEWYHSFQENPFHPMFDVQPPPPPPPNPAQSKRITLRPNGNKTVQSEFGKVTTAILSLCILLFVLASITTPKLTEVPEKLPLLPLFSSPINKELMYDYPLAYDFLDRAIDKFGVDEVMNPSQLPLRGKKLLKAALSTPYWNGGYASLVAFFSGAPNPWGDLEVPMFEKIQKGQVWRLITPCFLHYDIFHILFNMLWLIVLGRQMEKQLGITRYILFILIAGIFSNTAQYLMSGSNFLGYSGVICGMIMFIWMRQKQAPWEGYQLHPSTMLFITGFVFVIFGIQFMAFTFEVLGFSGFNLGIANTAHIAGGFAGYVLGKFNFLTWKS